MDRHRTLAKERTLKKALCILSLVGFLFAGLDNAEARSSGGRPYYGGGHHSSSHGGSYSGGHGSSHKGGHYKNPRTGNRYGRHK